MSDTTNPDTAAFVSVRSRVIQAIHSPLGFFVLALLIVETFLLGAGIWFGLSEGWKITAIGVGVALFVFVFLTVVWLVVNYPQNLVFSEESHIRFAALRIFGTEGHHITGTRLETLPPQSAPSPPAGQLPGPTEKT